MMGIISTKEYNKRMADLDSRLKSREFVSVDSGRSILSSPVQDSWTNIVVGGMLGNVPEPDYDQHLAKLRAEKQIELENRVKCAGCEQYGEVKHPCPNCGAPIDPVEERGELTPSDKGRGTLSGTGKSKAVFWNLTC